MASHRAGAVAVAGIAPNTIGAMHGLGRVTRPSISESPVVVAGAVPATRLTMLGALVTGSILWQLRIAAKLAIGLAPVPTRTRPVTWTSSFPVLSSSAFPEVLFQ